MNKTKKARTVNSVNRQRKATKMIFSVAAIACLTVLFGMISANAAVITPITADFVSDAKAKLKIIVKMIGGAIGVAGFMNLQEGYGSDNAAAKSQGWKQILAGAGTILISVLVDSITWQ